MSAAAAYLAAALLFTWPLARHPFSLLGSTQGPGDSYLNLWILGWDLRTLLHHPAEILSGHVFDANIFFPATGTLTYSDHLLLQAVAISPFYLLTGNLTFCYNVLLVASLALCALAMHAYVREIANGSSAAWVAGFAWGFAPYHFAHLGHLQLQALYFLPLALLCLHRVVQRRQWWDTCLLGLVAAGQALSSVYYGVIGGLAVFLTAIVYLIDTPTEPRWPLVRRLAMAAVISALLVAPVAVKYRWVQQREGFGRSLYESARGSATIGSYLEVPPENLLYGRLGILRSHDVADQAHRPAEQNLFPGFCLAGLALVGTLAFTRRDIRTPAIALAVVAVTGLVLSLGPEGAPWLYAWLYDTVFGFQAIRAPARFAVLVLFGLAGLAALGAGELRTWAEKRSGVFPVSLLVALLALEYANAPFAYVAAPRIETPGGQWLRANQQPGPVIYLPLSLDFATNTTFMLRSLAHGRHIVNGYSGQRPSFFTGLVDTLAGFPSAESVKTLLSLKVRFVIAPAPVATVGLPVVERARFPDEVIYELHASPDLDSKLSLPDAPSLPVPPSIPFAVGEQSTYAVTWMSGPMAVPAGRIVLDVRAGRNGSRYELAASGQTADWVSTFFRADDRFVSQVDERLRPLVFEQHLREGGRRVDRRAVFDRGSLAVRVQQGSGPEVSLPIAPDALDPLALFFYARTLPLIPGSTVRIPMNDSSRNSVVEVVTIGEETILYQGSQISTIRTTPQIRLAKDVSPVHMTIWFERVAPRRPLRAEISGLVGVGAVRLELE